jgi:hypothetical protein
MNLEVWFQSQDEISVFLESSIVDPDEERFHEISLFALFAARQFANLGRRDSVASSLSRALLSVDLARPLPSVQAQLQGARLVTPRAGGGRKGFIAEFRPEKRAFFKLRVRGLGILGRGAGYYGPTATLALLAYLLARRVDDSEFQRALAATAHFVGTAGSQETITLTSQAAIAMQAASAGWGVALMEDTTESVAGASGAEIEPVDDDIASFRETEVAHHTEAGDMVIQDHAVSTGGSMEHPLAELSGARLKTIFDAAFIDCRLDEDGDCVVQDDFRVILVAEPDKDALILQGVFAVTGTWEQAVAFCNRFNRGYLMCRAQAHDTQTTAGHSVIVIDHDRMVFEHESIEPKTIVLLVRRFVEITQIGIRDADEDSIF